MKYFHLNILKLIFSAMAVLQLISCSPSQKNITLPADVPDAFSVSGDQTTPDQWWTVFDDHHLNFLVEKSLKSNFNLESAWYRLQEAQATLKRERSALFPEVDGQLQGEKIYFKGDESDQLRLGLAAEYEVDLWGRIHSRIDAERYREQASFEDYQTAALSLSAEVSRTWFQLLEARERNALLEEQITANDKVLQLLVARFGAGVVRSVDILRQERLLEATREQKIIEEARIPILEHLLAVLAGQPPRALEIPETGTLPALPPLPKTGLPIELVQRRPDVRKAFHLLQAADREVATAISDRYPRLSLTASTSTIDDDTADLFDDWLSTLAANMFAPIVDGGRRRAEVERTKAIRDQRLSDYGQVSLEAFREVEDLLVLEKKQLELIDNLTEQTRLANLSYKQLGYEYLNGLSNYIDVLAALTSLQELQRNLLRARLNLLEIRVGLYRALGGGFVTERESQIHSTI